MGTGLAYLIGDNIYIKRTSAPSTYAMSATITAYNINTGATTISVYSRFGTGTYTDWTIQGGTSGADDWRDIQTNRYTNIAGAQIQIPKLAGIGLTFSASSLGQTNLIFYSTPSLANPKIPNGGGGRLNLIIGTGSVPAAGTTASLTNGVVYGLTYSLTQKAYLINDTTGTSAYGNDFGLTIVDAIVSLTPGITYWIDLQLTSNGYSWKSGTGPYTYGTGSIYIDGSNVKYSIVEIN